MASLVVRQYMDASQKFKKYTITPLVMAPIARILVDFIPPLFIAHILNSISSANKASFKELLPWAIAFMVVPFVGEILWRILFWFLNRADGRVMEYLANKVFARLIEREYSFHANNFAGALVAKTNRYVSGFEPLFDTLVFEVSGLVIPTIFALVILAKISWQIVIIFVAVFAVYLLVLNKLTREKIRLNKERAAQESTQTAQLADSITNATTIKTFSSEKYEAKLFAKTSADLYKKRLLSWDYQVFRSDLLTTNTIILLNGIAVIGSIYAYNYAGISAGAIYIVITYSLQLTGKFWNIGRIIRSIETNLSNANEMAILLDQPVEIVDHLEASNKSSNNIAKGIEFKNVSFCYDDDNESLFENLNLSIKPGEKIGLVGTSGGGKTTITKLLLRFYELNAGEILIDGKSIDKLSQSHLRSLISYVPQDPALFHRTIKENIAYAKPNIAENELLDVATKAHVREFVEKLPDKFDTMVGERGIKLSGGQRQRVAIARAMLKDAHIIVLDEATSALDSGSENLIQDALWQLMQGRTALVIAHRLSTIQRMDRIIVLENGKISEQGSHDELIKINGSYAKLWSHQSGGFIK